MIAPKRVVLTLPSAFRDFPWLWGVTSRWYPNDLVEVTPLTVPLLSSLIYSKITDLNGSSWSVYQRLRDGVTQVEDVRETGKYDSKPGMPLAWLVRRLPCVETLVELRVMSKHRHVVLYQVPQGPRGSKLKAYCVEVLKDSRVVHEAMREHQAVIDARIEEAIRKDAEKREFNPRAVLRQYRATSHERMERLARAVQQMKMR